MSVGIKQHTLGNARLRVFVKFEHHVSDIQITHVAVTGVKDNVIIN